MNIKLATEILQDMDDSIQESVSDKEQVKLVHQAFQYAITMMQGNPKVGGGKFQLNNVDIHNTIGILKAVKLMFSKYNDSEFNEAVDFTINHLRGMVNDK